MKEVFLIAARRTAVAPRNGAFRCVEVHALAKPVIEALLYDAQLDNAFVDHIVLGNALYGGGNPARVAALAADLRSSMPALTIDTQCCAGLDAIRIGASLIASGQARLIIAGGIESYSRSPLRAVRPLSRSDKPKFYDRPPFTPWPDADPDLIESAALLAAHAGVTRQAQEAFAIASHAKSMAARAALASEIVPVADLASDSFARNLSPAACSRLPLVAGDPEAGLTAATIAVEADAAAMVLLADEGIAGEIANLAPVRIVGSLAQGGDPRTPALAPVLPAQALLDQNGLEPARIAAVEIMEAFAVQAIAFVEALGLPSQIVNRSGGALARGHPIGASGAIIAVRLFHELQKEPAGAKGLAAIAAAGGLGSAMLLERN